MGLVRPTLPEKPLSSESQERQNQGWRASAASNSASWPCFSKTCMIKLLSLPYKRLAVLSNSLLSTLRRSSSLTSSMAASICPRPAATSLLVATFPQTSLSPACISERRRCILVDSDFQSSLFQLGFMTTVRTSPPPLLMPKANQLNYARNLRSQARCTIISLRQDYSPSFCEPVNFCAILTFPSPRDSSGSSSAYFSSLACSQQYSPLS